MAGEIVVFVFAALLGSNTLGGEAAAMLANGLALAKPQIADTYDVRWVCSAYHRWRPGPGPYWGGVRIGDVRTGGGAVAAGVDAGGDRRRSRATKRP